MNKRQRISDVVASSSNSSSALSSKKYGVFLSFRGDDTRLNFTSHLDAALKDRDDIETFIDNRIEKGDEISEALIKAIEDSHICIVIFSENYTTSKWCLNELSKIMELKKENGHIVIPVFYKVDPSDVRHQIGRYKEAFAKHEGHSMYTKWKSALTDAANLSGWHSQNRSEAELIKDIIQDVLEKLDRTCPIQHKKIVGIEKRYREIESLLKIDSREVIKLGIWGMGGIGKTTLATVLYDKLSYRFESHCFLANVREKSGNLEDLCKELSSQLLRNKNHGSSNCDMSKLPRKKYFIVLDDVSEPEQLDKLIGEYDFMGTGSRVIVTARDKQILSTLDEIFPLGELDLQYSLELFCLSVFGEKQPKEGYEDLSQEVISYCKGVPLALKVLGANLRTRTTEAWKSGLSKLHKIQNQKIHDVLKLSYDGLDPFVKDIFLDIACFFKGRNKKDVIEILDAFDFCPTDGIEILVDKALITISNWNEIKMHDLIEEMGQAIVHQESKKYPEKRSRLWKQEDVLDLFKDNKGTDNVEGIILDLSQLEENLSFNSDVFGRMNNLRFLEVKYYYPDINNVYFNDGLESLSNKLRYLDWNNCSLVSWPRKFCAEHLVHLHMRGSNFKKLWDGSQNLTNLKSIDLTGSDKLVEIPDLSKAQKLENVSLELCRSLRQLHPSTLSLPKLIHLNLRGCQKIESLDSNVHLNSLKELNLSRSGIRALPPSIGDLLSLEVLLLHRCKKLVSLPKLPASIRVLDLIKCYELETLPKLPSLLEILYLKECWKLMSLPKLPQSLTTLELSFGKELEYLPELPQFLTSLEIRDFVELKSLPKLPQSLTTLQVNNCEKLESLPGLPQSLTTLELSECMTLESLPKLPQSLTRLTWKENVYVYNWTSLQTDMIQEMVLQHMLENRIPYIHQQCLNNRDFFMLPGDHIKECRFHTTSESLITIPCLPKSDLLGFICCIILSKTHLYDSVPIRILEDGKQVGTRYMDMDYIGVLYLAHVLFCYVDIWELSRISEVDDQFGTITFEFGNKWVRKGIKGCGVFPVYMPQHRD